MPVAICPPATDLQCLFRGGLPTADVEALESHLQECGPCMAKLKELMQANDTLVDVLRGDTQTDAAGPDPVVDTLMARLKSLRTASASSHQGTAMSSPNPFENLSAASVANNPPTDPSASNPEVTQSDAAPSKTYDASLTDFLAPKLADDELGRLGKYRILQILGYGGMGVVYKAEDPKLKRTVAIKAMLPTLAASASAGKRFLREAEAMAAVEHDHIVRIYQIDEDRGVPYMAMEFLKGQSLDERLKGEPAASAAGCLPLADVLKIGREIALALDAAHARGLIHRDIKPGNIWLERKDEGGRMKDETQKGLPDSSFRLHPSSFRVKLLDFGLARAASQESGITQQGAIIGTPAYMAPEQGRGDTVDARCDLFSLGVVLYRMSTGQAPFGGKDTVSTLMSVAMDDPTPPIMINFDLPQEFSDLVMKLLEKDPTKRVSSAGEVVAALDRMEKDLIKKQEAEEKTHAVSFAEKDQVRVARPESSKGVLGPSDTVTPFGVPQGVPPRSRRRLLVAAGLLFAALLAGGAYLAGIIRIGTDQGDYVIATDDPDFSFSVSKGTVKLTDQKTGRTYDMKVSREKNGVFELDVTDVGADLSFTTKEFTIKRGQKVALKAHFERHQPEAQARATPAALAGEWFGGDNDWGKVVITRKEGEYTGTYTATFNKQLGNFYLKPAGEGRLRGEWWESDKKRRGTFELNLADNGRSLQVAWEVSAIDKGQSTWKLVKAAGTPVDDAWIKMVQALAAEKQVDAVVAKLKELNPGFDGKAITPEFDKTAGVVAIGTGSNGLKNISPFRALTQLQALRIIPQDNVPLADVSPLRGLKLRELLIDSSLVSDLSPLQDMPMTILDVRNTKITDLTCLSSLRLTTLIVSGTAISDLTPLRKMPLTYLNCGETQVADLSALQGMSFLTHLIIGKTKVSDLAPLKTLPLKELWCDFRPERDAAILRSIKTLETINGQPAAEFWKRVDAQQADFDAWLKQVAALPAKEQVDAVAAKLKDLNPGFDGMLNADADGPKVIFLEFNSNHVTDISPLQALRALQRLKCGCELGKGKLTDLSPLNGLKLVSLDIHYTKVSNLAPLKNMKLTYLDAIGAPVSDFSPLKEMPLEFITCQFNAERDAPILRAITTLKSINGKSAKEFWQSVDAPSKGVDDAWLKQVTALPAKEQVSAVAAKLKKLNPGFDGKMRSEVRGNVVLEIGFVADKVSNISPLKALPKLHALSCEAISPTVGQLFDLSPLAGMNLEALFCGSTMISDLSPLRGMPLTVLNCSETKIANLAPLAGMKLTTFACSNTAVSDLTLLKGMPLERLFCAVTSVSSLTPLKGMKLIELHCQNTKVTDLSPLRDMPLKVLYCDFLPERDATILRSIKTLETINGQPAAEFWKKVEGK